MILPHINGSLDRSQFAYRPGPGGGVVPALTLLHHRILNFLDSKSGAVRLLTVDFAKAFDKITHTTIVSACRQFQLPASTVQWIEDFLSDRSQRVRYNGTTSRWAKCTSGVPQGSVLGPILFCLATDSIRPLFSNTSVVRFADDITLLHCVRDKNEDKLQVEWNHLVSWTKDINLPLNPSKCKVMNIVTRRNLTLDPIFQGTEGTLQEVKTMRLLGVTFSHDLKFNSHVMNILKKASSRMFVLCNLKRAKCPAPILWQTYTALIQSVLLFAYPSFSNIPDYLKKILLRIENRARRIIGTPKQPSLFSVADSVCLKLFQRIRDETDHPLREMFEVRNRKSRHQSGLIAPRTKTERFKKSFIKYSSL